MSAPSECSYCGKPRPQDPETAWRKGWRRSWCAGCFQRWRRHGSPPDGPPPPRPAGAPGRPQPRRLARVEDYLELRSWGLSDAQAAPRLGVSRRTLDRYKRHLRETAGAS